MVRCPYCDAKQEICHDDGCGYSEDQKHQQECVECDKLFIFETTIVLSYEASKADCLNGGRHDWQPTFTVPIERTRGYCTICHEERPATPHDMVNARAHRKALQERFAEKGVC